MTIRLWTYRSIGVAAFSIRRTDDTEAMTILNRKTETRELFELRVAKIVQALNDEELAIHDRIVEDLGADA